MTTLIPRVFWDVFGGASLGCGVAVAVGAMCQAWRLGSGAPALIAHATETVA